jgi:sporulation protein YhbH
MIDSIRDIWKLRRIGKLDSSRHKERIKKAIKENLRELVTDASIISSDGKKKIKIPVRYLDSYRFKHGENKNQERVGQGNKDGKPGDAIAHDGSGKKDKDSKAGDSQGEDLYEEEIALAEVIDMMLEDLHLPWLEKKDSTVEVETENIKFTDISDVGPLSNVDKRRTVYENMRRNAKEIKSPIIKSIRPEDLRYKVWETEIEYHSNAAVYFLMDRSGSMDEDKKYIAKSFFFWLAHFCKTKYSHVELVFIAHDTTAKIVEEEGFFTITNSGGTMCSSAFQLALENIETNHPPRSWNNYVFAFSDGDNWPEDNGKCIKMVQELLEVCTAVGYGEIDINSFFNYGIGWSQSTLHEEFKKHIEHPRFLTAVIQKKDDIYNCLKEFLGIDSSED